MIFPYARRALAAIALAILVRPASADSVNLVRNGDFDRCFAGSGPADGWSAERSAPGGVNAQVVRGGVDDGACHRLTVPDAAPVDWYMCREVVRPLSPGDTGFFSASVRTVGVHDGHGAYISLNYLDASGERVGFTDSAQVINGTTGWVRIVQPFVVPSRTSHVTINLILYGHGTAYFDRAVVATGDRPMPWIAAPRRAAAADGPARVAIFREEIPPSGTASDPNRLSGLARAAGYRCTFVTASELADPARLTADRFDVLLLPYGGSFPAAAADNIRTFLESGGSLLTVGGYPFDRPLVYTEDGWLATSEVEPSAASLRPLLAPASSSDLWRTSGRDISSETAGQSIDRGHRAVVFSTPALPNNGWVTLEAPPVAGLPADTRSIAFLARSESPDLSISVELDERDGARWRAIVPLAASWRNHGINISDLEYWKDNPSVGRGFPGDRPHLGEVVGIRFGITTELSHPGRPYEARIGAIWTSAQAQANLTHVRLNSATGGVNPATFLVSDPAAISVCDAGAPLSDAARLTPSPGVFDIPGTSGVAGGFQGWSATGQTGMGDPGAPLKARWEPLADAVDRYGRKRGTAFGIMWNYAGSYPGSAWAYSGIANHDVFRTGDAFGEGLFRAALARLTRGVFLYDGQATPACARPGEKIVVGARVGSLSHTARRARVKILAENGGRIVARHQMTVLIPARGSTAISWMLPSFSGRSGLVRLHLSVEAAGSPPDGLMCGAALWSLTRQTAGAKLDYRRCYFDKGRGPEFLLGSQIYWGNLSVTGTDPLRWADELRGMADNGISVARAFLDMQGADRDTAWRHRDAMVQLAQEAGISLFYEGISTASEDPERIAKQAEYGRAAALRYRSSPGWLVDIRNEPTLPLSAKGPNAQRIMSERMRDWAARTRAAIVGADPKRLVTVGYLQGLGYGSVTWDPIVGSRDMDFANRHYYGGLSDYATELKQVDLRLLGKAPSTGEFGCTSHPGLKTHFVYETEQDATVRYGYVPHACFGLGGALCANWHWQDPIEDIFPCGLFLADGAPRDRLIAFRNSGALFRAIHPRYEPPSVWLVIPDGRLGPHKSAVEAAMNRAIEALIGLHVEFGVVSEDDLGKLPGNARATIWPVDNGTAPTGRRAELCIPEKTRLAAEIRSQIADFLARAGVRRHALTPDIAELQSFRVPCEDGTVAHILWNTTPQPQRVTLTDLPRPVEILLAARAGGFVAFDGRGRLIAAEGCRVTVGGNPVLTGAATVGAVSLDGRDLRASGRVLILPSGAGSMRLFGEAATSRVSVGEYVERRWTEYERVRPANGTLNLDAAMARSWLIAGEADGASALER